jgi:hypothetical protein
MMGNHGCVERVEPGTEADTKRILILSLKEIGWRNIASLFLYIDSGPVLEDVMCDGGVPRCGSQLSNEARWYTSGPRVHLCLVQRSLTVSALITVHQQAVRLVQRAVLRARD